MWISWRATATECSTSQKLNIPSTSLQSKDVSSRRHPLLYPRVNPLRYPPNIRCPRDALRALQRFGSRASFREHTFSFALRLYPRPDVKLFGCCFQESCLRKSHSLMSGTVERNSKVGRDPRAWQGILLISKSKQKINYSYVIRVSVKSIRKILYYQCCILVPLLVYMM